MSSHCACVDLSRQPQEVQRNSNSGVLSRRSASLCADRFSRGLHLFLFYNESCLFLFMNHFLRITNYYIISTPPFPISFHVPLSLLPHLRFMIHVLFYAVYHSNTHTHTHVYVYGFGNDPFLLHALPLY